MLFCRSLPEMRHLLGFQVSARVLVEYADPGTMNDVHALGASMYGIPPCDRAGNRNALANL
jgi:hypothetical protein